MHYLSSVYLRGLGARKEAPKSEVFFLLNINLFVSIVNKFGGQPKVDQTQFAKMYVNGANGTSTILHIPAKNFHFQAKFFQGFIPISHFYGSPKL